MLSGSMHVRCHINYSSYPVCDECLVAALMHSHCSIYTVVFIIYLYCAVSAN